MKNNSLEITINLSNLISPLELRNYLGPIIENLIMEYSKDKYGPDFTQIAGKSIADVKMLVVDETEKTILNNPFKTYVAKNGTEGILVHTKVLAVKIEEHNIYDIVTAATYYYEHKLLRKKDNLIVFGVPTADKNNMLWINTWSIGEYLVLDFENPQRPLHLSDVETFELLYTLKEENV